MKMFVYVVVRIDNEGKVKFEKAFYSRSSAESYIFSMKDYGEPGSLNVEEVPLVEQSFI